MSRSFTGQTDQSVYAVRLIWILQWTITVQQVNERQKCHRTLSKIRKVSNMYTPRENDNSTSQLVTVFPETALETDHSVCVQYGYSIRNLVGQLICPESSETPLKTD